MYLRGGGEISVDGAADDVAKLVDGARPVRLITLEGDVIFVNWANVLYIREESRDRPPIPGVSAGQGRLP